MEDSADFFGSFEEYSVVGDATLSFIAAFGMANDNPYTVCHFSFLFLHRLKWARGKSGREKQSRSGFDIIKIDSNLYEFQLINYQINMLVALHRTIYQCFDYKNHFYISIWAFGELGYVYTLPVQNGYGMNLCRTGFCRYTLYKLNILRQRLVGICKNAVS